MKHIPSRLWAMMLLMVSVMLPSAVLADGSHRLTVVAKPTMAGSFNTNSADLVAGETIHLYAYSNGNFDFVHWTDNTGAVVSEQMDFTYIMPNRDVTLTAEYNYNPANPANPASNYWDREHGELIVDDFETGSLSNAVYNALGNSDDSKVNMLTVAGVINNNDFGIANYFSNCSVLDLSRVTGVTAVPSYAFDYANFESVKLPATIETIGYYAFGECSKLSSITLYAMTPPTLESEVFSGVPEGLVVYVPAGAIGQYQDSEAWNQFTLLPIQEDIRNITVSLSSGVKASDYARMWLEMTNTKSGQRIHYIMTDRSVYTFANIIKNTSWNVALRNERGDVFGKIDNVEVKDEDVSVSFASLSKPLNVSLKVQTPDGKNVTEQTQITWTDASGNYIAQGTSLSSLPVGCQLNYSVALSQDLAMLYGTPKAAAYTLKDGTNSLTCKLKAIKQVKVTGKVKDATSGLTLSGAVISASQTFGGKYSKTINAKTDANGVYTLTVYDVPTTMAFAATDYISQSIVCDELIAGKATVDMNDVSLKPISGATINVGFTFTNVDGETQNWYSDYQNVSYTLYNKTRKKAINQFNVQYPQIVLLEEVSEGDVLELTAESKTQTFKPVKATATITANQTAEAQFSIVELGQLKAEYSQSGNVDVVASLYDASGKLVKTYNYRDMSLAISNLADGKYTLVSMGSSQFFNSIYDLAQLPQSGLKAGTDYVQNAVTVKSGKVTTVNIDLVPKLDESKLYYTGDNTSFTVNKPSIVAGNYLTLTGHLSFKPAYETGVSNVQMIVDLPETCEFVENSVMVGNSTGNYTLNGHQLTIPMARYSDRVRFCIIPTAGGDYAPSAFAQFKLNGKTIKQPIGSANYTAKDLSISVPKIVAKTTIPISGTAIGASTINIYDNGVLIGQTTSQASGSWSTTCELNEPYNLSTHNIYAKVTTKGGIDILSETRSCFYDKNCIEVNDVEMTFYNGWLGRNVNVVFDFKNVKTDVTSYMFYTGTDITFIANLTNNDPALVSDVIINVFTDKNEVKRLPATYNDKKDRWIAVSRFESNNLPVNVSVSIKDNTPIEEDTEHSQSLVSEYNEDLNSNTVLQIDTRIEEIIDKINKGIDVDDEINSLESEIDDEICKIELSEDDNIIVESLVNAKTEEEFQNVWVNVVRKYKVQDEVDSWIGAKRPQSGVINIDNLHTSGTPKVTYQRKENSSNISGGNGDYTNEDSYINSDWHIDEASIENASSASPSVRLTNSSTGDQMTIDLSNMLPDPGSTRTEYNGFINAVDNLIDNFGTQADMTLSTMEAWANEGVRNMKHQQRLLGEVCNKTKQLPNQERAIELMKKERAEGIKRISKAKGIHKGLDVASKSLNRFLTGYQTNNDLRKGFKSYDNWTDLIGDLYTLCSSSEAQHLEKIAQNYQRLDRNKNVGIGIGNAAVAVGTATGIAAAPETLGASLVITLVSGIASWGISSLANKFEQDNDKNFQKVKQMISNSDDCKPNPDDDGNNNRPYPDDDDYPNPPFDPISPIHDPSGYVYEGVPSNRIVGATATVFYKETVEDMYGDLHDNIVKWDAEEYAQENPLFTDENGMYAWDVPKGLWQVKFEKEGYETTYSEWLPVPPPQLDINIPMKQNVQPVVKSARAFQDAVELEFDKYMMPEQLTTENITVMVGKKAVTGTIKLLDEEVSREGETETFASKVRFNAAKPFEGTEVTLMVSNRVKSYAGIRMQDDFSQQFTIEEEVRQIDCKEMVKVAYGHNSTVSVAVLPASAAAAKTLKVKSSSAMILSTDAESLVLDKDGRAEIKVHGEMPGTAALTFSVDGYDLTATTTVNVVTTLLGDVNGDGEVNAADIVVLQNYLSGRQTTGIDEFAADADGDGNITVADVPAIVAIILNKR